MRLTALLALILLLTACKVRPNYSRPATPSIPAFRAPAPLPDTTAASLANTKWFDVFEDPELRKLIEEALQQNFDLRLATARVEAARGNVGVVRANQIPNIGATADITTLRNSRTGSFPLPETVAQERNFGSTGLNLLAFELDLWGRLRRATEAARADLLASESNRQAVIVTLVSDVAAAYFTLRELDLELEIARRTVATRRESQRLIETRQKGGVATLLDVRQAEQLVYSATQAIPDLQRAIEQTENRLSLLLGRAPGPIPRGASLTEQKQPASIPTGLPSELLERRPDIRAAEQSLIAANAQIGVAKAAYFPRLALTSSTGFQSNALSRLWTGPTAIWNVTPQLTQPIFQVGRLGANVNIAKANEQAALVQYERAIQSSFREVSDSLVQYQRVKEILAQQNLLVTTLQDRSRLAYLRYRGGVDTLLNALDSDRDLFSAELNQARTQRDELLALVQLYKALGGGWN
jgi:multidrug efflux system outer membrane protein